jgi:hypothetical protein
LNRHDFDRTLKVLGVNGFHVFESRYAAQAMGSWLIKVQAPSGDYMIVYEARDFRIEMWKLAAERADWRELWIGPQHSRYSAIDTGDKLKDLIAAQTPA